MEPTGIDRNEGSGHGCDRGTRRGGWAGSGPFISVRSRTGRTRATNGTSMPTRPDILLSLHAAANLQAADRGKVGLEEARLGRPSAK